MNEEPLDVQCIKNWARGLEDKGQLYCPYCVTELMGELTLYCPNEMCLFEEGYRKEDYVYRLK